MKKLLIIFSMVVLFFNVVLLSGCNTNTNNNPSVDVKDKFIGTWQKQNSLQNLTFFSNGTVPNYIPSVTGNWEVNDKNLIISISISQITFNIIYDFSFSDDYKTLTLTLIQPKGVGYDDTAGTYNKL
jgi:PBP1b-binding outer membrane lipoprotein LpoB